jgi:HK97 gp10 family phage protein
MALKATFRGRNRVRRVLARIPEEFRAEIGQSIERTAKRIVDDAKTRVPVETGTLKAAIDYRVAKNGLTATLGIRRKAARRDAFYAHFVEFGTRAHQVKVKTARILRDAKTGRVFGARVTIPALPARPFLTPAFEAAKPEGVADIRAAVRSALTRASKAAGGED